MEQPAPLQLSEHWQWPQSYTTSALFTSDDSAVSPCPLQVVLQLGGVLHWAPLQPESHMHTPMGMPLVPSCSAMGSCSAVVGVHAYAVVVIALGRVTRRHAGSRCPSIRPCRRTLRRCTVRTLSS